MTFETVLVRPQYAQSFCLPIEGGSLNQPRTYLWLPAYTSAVLETDDALIPTRIYEALAAIEQRLLSPIETDSTEYREIENTQRGLLTLKAERVDEGNALECTRVTRAGQQ